MKNKRKNWNPLKKIEEGPLHSACQSWRYYVAQATAPRKWSLK